jgi:hypothetical protein
MTQKHIYDIVKSLPLSAESYWLVMGAALVMHGVREETDDIDIGCTHERFDLLLKSGYCSSVSQSGLRKIALTEHVTVYENFYKQNIVYIDGIPVADLESIRVVKSVFGREKDMADIELIDRQLARMKQNDQLF